MGGAGLALTGDKDSAMMNPASLADVEGTDWQLFPVLIEVPFAVDTLQTGLDYNDARDGNDTAAKKAALEKFLREAGSSSYRTRMNLYPSYTRRYMHFGLLFDTLADDNFRMGGLGSNQLMEAGDTSITAGAILSGGYGFDNNSIQVGATLRPMYRVSPFENYDQRVLDVAAGKNAGSSVQNQIFGNDAAKRTAMGVAVDAGAKYWLQTYGSPADGFYSRFVKQWKPSFGVTYQDIGNTRVMTDKNLPADIKQSVSVGMAVQPSWRFVETAWALDFRNVTDEKAIWNKLHFGAEALLWKFWAIRAGVSQGYITGGMGINIPFFEMDVYVAAKEAGSYASIDEVRTIGLRLSLTL